MPNNADLMYKYTEKEVEVFDKSIDTLGIKLTSTLAFGGVLIKFASDLSSSYLKTAILIFIAIAIISAFVGLFPRDRGDVVRAYAFEGERADWWYGCSSEEFQLTMIRQWIIHIEKLEELLDFRAFWLKFSQASLCLATLILVFGWFVN